MPSVNGVYEMNSYTCIAGFSVFLCTLYTEFRLTDFNTILYEYFGITNYPRIVLSYIWDELMSYKDINATRCFS
jgi:hypothetical protein